MALAARARAHAPYSHFRVGAALACRDGSLAVGCNIENASYGLTVCAERVAAFHAVALGLSGFSELVVAADTPNLTPPCGACRQVLWELCGDIRVTLVNLQGATEQVTLADLFPRPFDRRYL